MTIYIALYMATLFAACVRGDRAYITGLWMIFGLSLMAWIAPNPLLWLACSHLIVSAYFFLISECKKCTIAASLLAIGAFACSAAYFLNLGAARPLPDFLAVLGHAANLCAFLIGGSGGRLDRILRLRGVRGHGNHHFVSLCSQDMEKARGLRA